MDIAVWIKENASWLDLVKDLGIFSIAAYFIQRIMDNSANRRLEHYKHELDLATRQHQATIDSGLEKFKADLTLHLNRQSSLHEKHLGIIDQMYKYLAELDSAMREMTAFMKPVYDDAEKEDQVRVERAQKAFLEYNNYYIFNKLYFTNNVCTLLEAIRKDYHSANYDYFEPKRLASFTGGKPSPEGYREATKVAMAASKRIANDIPETLRLLEVEFRKLLGVE